MSILSTNSRLFFLFSINPSTTAASYQSVPLLVSPVLVHALIILSAVKHCNRLPANLPFSSFSQFQFFLLESIGVIFLKHKIIMIFARLFSSPPPVQTIGTTAFHGGSVWTNKGRKSGNLFISFSSIIHRSSIL